MQDYVKNFMTVEADKTDYRDRQCMVIFRATPNYYWGVAETRFGFTVYKAKRHHSSGTPISDMKEVYWSDHASYSTLKIAVKSIDPVGDED